jgi:anthranilate synthase/aminodeoxychorismate synthase-like glutamine amidotransferase
MLLMIDNYDSFTYNLVQYLGELGQQVTVYRNDRISIADISAMSPQRIVISPGPCTPDEAGISLAVVRHFAPLVPILGVCLGHQCIAQAFGGSVVHAYTTMHGKTSMIRHQGESVFYGLPSPFEATRYHSLIVAEDTLPDCLAITARAHSQDGLADEIMGVQHRHLQVTGVQFHPEAILTRYGHQLLANFLAPGQGQTVATAPPANAAPENRHDASELAPTY